MVPDIVKVASLTLTIFHRKIHIVHFLKDFPVKVFEVLTVKSVRILETGGNGERFLAKISLTAMVSLFPSYVAGETCYIVLKS